MNLQDVIDRFEIEALRGEYTDAGMMRDLERLVSLFTEDGGWRIPHAGIEFLGREEIRAGLHRLWGNWEFLVQNTHPGTIQVAGDTATGRAYVAEVGRFRDGSSHLNFALFHDEYRRTAEGWKFAERVYEIRYVDTSPLVGTGFGID